MEKKDIENVKVALHGAYFPNNYGDVLILYIQSMWLKEIANVEIFLPYATSVYIEKLPVSNIQGTKTIREADLLVYGAGGYFGEPLQKKWRWGFSFVKNHYKPYYYAKKEGIPVIINAPGFGPLSNLFTRKLVRKIYEEAIQITVRDHESNEYIKKYRYDVNQIEVTADVALTLDETDIPQYSRQYVENFFKNVDAKKMKFGIHLGVSLNSSKYGKKMYVLLEELVEFLNNHKFLQPILIVDNKNKAQLESVSILENRLNSPSLVYIHEDVWNTTAILASLDYVLTNKLHVGIVSYTYGAVPISIPYHSKTERFYKQINCQELCLPLIELKRGDVKNVLNKTLDQKWRNEYEKKYKENKPILKDKAFENKELLQKTVSMIKERDRRRIT